MLVKAEGRLLAPEMVEIRAGRFQMGCVSGRDCQDNEKPVHEVTIESFALSKYEVTFEEYDRFTDATGHQRVGDSGWGRGKRPVINVSWSDAVAYAEWLSAQAGESYRLPSEAEWEYAARAGSVTAYSWGNEIGRNRANCMVAAVSGMVRRRRRWARSAPMPGAFTTCTATCGSGYRDCWNESYKVTPTDRGSSGRGSGDGQRENESHQVAPTDGSAWQSGDCGWRVSRGGSWVDRPGDLRAAVRALGRSTAARVNIFGCRVARTLAP